MRIAIFDGSFETTAFIRRLIKGLVRAGHKVYVLGFNEELKHPIDKVHYIPLGSNQSKWRFLSTWFANTLKNKDVFQRVSMLFRGQKKLIQQKNLDDFIRREEPEIIHLQWPSLLVWLDGLLNKNKTKLVLSQRGSQTNIRPFIDKNFMSFLKGTYPNIDALHSVAYSVKKNGELIHNDESIMQKVIYTGLDLDEFKIKKKSEVSSKINILAVGRNHWVKDYSTALKAFYILKNKNVDFSFCIVGVEFDEELFFLRKSLALENRVDFKNKVDHKELKEIFYKSDLLLLSSMQEGIANVAVEAMALGVPVISTDCGGMKELITHEEEGWIVPTRDPEAIAKAVMNIIKLPEERIDKVRTNARIKVEKQHSEGKMINDMEALYKEVLDK